MTDRRRWAPLALALCAACVWPGDRPPEALRGFRRSPHFGEWVREATLAPDVHVLVNAPGDFDPARPTLVIFYALPNGNTIAQTFGRRMTEGLDWHFDIQHVGAQTRLLRQVLTDRNVVLALLEAEGRSWPSWRRTHSDSDALIARLLEEVFPLGDPRTRWALVAHSGGGSLIWGFLNAREEIPDKVDLIALLDANYSYSDEDGHGDKLLAWLRRDPRHRLVVLAYDDRSVELDGRRIVGDTGGTYRATVERMVPRLQRDIAIEASRDGAFLVWRGLDGRADLRVHTNPDRAILHTLLVERNGLIHAVTVATPWENRAGRLWGDRAYEAWIQEGE